jgi:branched-chain amino acid transport system ATP-binding protein
MTAVHESPSPTRSATLALKAEHVTVRFGGLKALDDVDIEVPPATIIGLVGPNGAGKTTLFGVLSGILRPNAGRVELGGVDITGAPAQQRARLGMARTFQQLELFQELTVREHVVLGYRIRNARRRIWSDLVDGRGWRRSPQDEDDRVDALIDLLGLGGVAQAPVAALPLGTCRRVEVARALATQPSVLLLDEPSSGLDARETDQLSQALRTVVDEEGVAMLLVEHDVGMVLGLSARVTVLDFGSRIAEGTPDQIREDPKVRSAYLGDDTTHTGESR